GQVTQPKADVPPSSFPMSLVCPVACNSLGLSRQHHTLRIASFPENGLFHCRSEFPTRLYPKRANTFVVPSPAWYGGVSAPASLADMLRRTTDAPQRAPCR